MSKLLVVALVSGLVGLGAGILVPARPPGGSPPEGPSPRVEEQGTGDRREAEVRELLDRLSKTQASLDAANRALASARQAAAQVPGPGPAPPAAKAPTPLETAWQIRGELERSAAENDREIARLRDELERAKATLPEPQVLQDLKSASTAELVALALALRVEAQQRLLTPPEDLKSRFGGFLQRADSGTARILPRGKYDHIIEKRAGGAYWSFVTRDNDYDKEPDLELQGDSFGTGFYGGSTGWFLPLGSTSPDQVGTSVQAPPPELDEKDLERWSFLWSDTPFSDSDPAAGRKRLGTMQEQARSLGLSSRVPAAAGRTYLLRAVLEHEHDILVVFHTAGSDDTGMDLVWQVLRNWNIPRRR